MAAAVEPQLVEVPRENGVAIDIVHALFAVLERAGVSRLQLLEEARREGREFNVADARVSRAVVFWLCERAIELTGDPALGLHWSKARSSHRFAPLPSLIAHAATLRQALESLSRFDRLFSDETAHELLERDDRVIVRCANLASESPRIHRFAAEASANAVFRMLRGFGVPPRSVQVSFTYAAPSYRAEYARVFMGAERFEQPFNGLEFDRAFLSAASPLKDDDVHSALRSIAERRLLGLTQSTPYAVRVRELLVQRGAVGRTDMHAVASALGLSERTLRRRLCEEGKTYRAVVNDALVLVAEHQLLSTPRTIQEIAYDLGFSDASAFYRAFKRRTGTTPQAYRAAQLRNDNRG